jgi:hypothetical protein
MFFCYWPADPGIRQGCVGIGRQRVPLSLIPPDRLAGDSAVCAVELRSIIGKLYYQLSF